MEGYRHKRSKNILHQATDYIIPHVHDDVYEVVFYVSGEGRTSYADMDNKYVEDTLLIVEPGVVHDEYTIARSHVLCCEFATLMRFRSGIYIKGNDDADQFESVKNTLIEMDIVSHEVPINSERLDELLSKMLVSLSAIQMKNDVQLQNYQYNLVEHVKSSIRKDFSKHLNYVMLCEGIGYSYDRFRHVFKSFTGLGMDEYRQSIMIAYAKESLKMTNKKVSEIAFTCGYQKVSAFIDQFKVKTGITPHVFRRLVRQNMPMGVYNAEKKEAYQKLIYAAKLENTQE